MINFKRFITEAYFVTTHHGLEVKPHEFFEMAHQGEVSGVIDPDGALHKLPYTHEKFIKAIGEPEAKKHVFVTGFGTDLGVTHHGILTKKQARSVQHLEKEADTFGVNVTKQDPSEPLANRGFHWTIQPDMNGVRGWKV